MDEDRFTGCLLGLGVGDALGAPLEFMSAEQILIKHGVVKDMLGGGWLHLRPGQTTDDTAMALALAGSLLERGGFDRDGAAARYVEWFRTGPRDVGNTVRAALSRIAEGANPDEAAAAAHAESGGRSAGNGALMRAAPIALAYRDEPDALIENTRLDARITHFDPLAGWTAAASNLMIVGALRDEKDKRALLAHATETLAGKGSPLSLPDPSARHASELNPTGFAVETLECALWAFRGGRSFEDCLVRAANLGGDADTIAAVCGALAGAWYGAAKIPERWLKVLDRRRELEAAGRGLFRLIRDSGQRGAPSLH